MIDRGLSVCFAILCVLSTGYAAASTPRAGDPIIYIGPNTPPAPGAGRDVRYPRDVFKGKVSHYERELARWKDPTTLPQSKTECVQWASGDWPWGGHWETCVGWKTSWRWMHNYATLVIDTPDLVDVGAAVEDCLKQGAVAAALTAIVSGGSGAAAAFEGTVKACLALQLGEKISVQVRLTSAWGDFE